MTDDGLRRPSANVTLKSMIRRCNGLSFTFSGEVLLDMFDDLKGKTGAVFGVANKRSIAWAIAQGLQAAGSSLANT